MKLAAVLLIRDEVDIIRQWCEHHLNIFDFVIATDNGSIDGTRQILEQFPVEIIDEPGRDYQQDAWTHRMILRARKQGADWIMPLDADEFLQGHIWDEIEDTPGCALQIPLRDYIPHVNDDWAEPDPIQRMQCFIPGGVTAKHFKICFRAAAYTRIHQGNHDADMIDKWGRVVGRNIRIHHYPERSLAQITLKYIRGGEAYARSAYPQMIGAHWREAHDRFLREGIAGLESIWRESVME